MSTDKENEWHMDSQDGRDFKKGIQENGIYDGVDLLTLVKTQPFCRYSNKTKMLQSLRAALRREMAARRKGKAMKNRLSTLMEDTTQPDTCGEKKLVLKTDSPADDASMDDGSFSPFEDDLSSRQIIFYNPESASQNIVLIVFLTFGMGMDNVKAIRFDDSATNATITYETTEEFVTLGKHIPLDAPNGAVYNLLYARVHVDNQIARSATTGGTHILCTMEVELPFPVYTRKKHYRVQELKVGLDTTRICGR